MKQILFLAILLFATKLMQAQDNTKPIEMMRYAGKIYHQDTKKLNRRDLINLTKDVPEAQRFMNKASNNEIVSSMLGGIGGFLIGLPLRLYRRWRAQLECGRLRWWDYCGSSSFCDSWCLAQN